MPILWDHRQLKLEIAQRAAQVVAERQSFAAQTDGFRTVLRGSMTSTKTLGITFLVGFVYGLMGDRHWLPEGLRYLFWRSGSKLFMSLLATPLSAMAQAATAPEV